MEEKSFVGSVLWPRVVDGRTITVPRLSEVLREEIEAFHRPFKTVVVVAITVGPMREVIDREAKDDV